MSPRRIVVGFVLAVAMSSPVFAQWPLWMPSGVPMTADGKPDLNAPARRTADGKPDLSGVWETMPPPRAAGAGTEPGAGTTASRVADAPAPGVPGPAAAPAPVPSGSVFGNVGAQVPGGAPYQPWAAELVKQRMADNSKDNPDAHCLPMGVMQMTSHPFPRKIVQTPTEILIIYEASGTTVREVFLDGRPLPPPDAQPWWNGYSIGRWEGDTLVVETARFLDDGWLDVRGSPLTSAGKLIERYRRPTYGTLEIEVTIDDPKAYTKPFTAKVTNRLLIDSQLIEFVCLDKDAPHYVGAEYNKK
ncbi:MAG TPA: hypothetical protein VM818_23325 [Vicinamibacterales bacterium]|jgi:hypothetical protein|nr:hypothetical protein [Vicinamibacterales bacterium]